MSQPSDSKSAPGISDPTINHFLVTLRSCPSNGDEPVLETPANFDWKKFWAATEEAYGKPLETTLRRSAGGGTPLTRKLVELKEAAPTNVAQTRIAAAVMFAGAGAAATVVATLWGIAKDIYDEIQADRGKRITFTQETINRAFAQNQYFNYVICCTPHRINAEGLPGMDWSTREIVLGQPETKYWLHAFRGGHLIMDGDGGYLNWACTSRYTPVDSGVNTSPRTILFYDPQR